MRVDYEVCKRLEPLTVPKPKSFLQRLFGIIEYTVPVETLMIRTDKTKKEICEYYGGPAHVISITECTTLKHQAIPII